MIFLLFLPIIVSALTYNDPCQKKCDLPGLVCENNRCQCDSKQQLFWTGARCFTCPNSWTRSETACIAYYHTKLTWDAARSTCRNLKAELISFRRPDIADLIYTLRYQVTQKKREVTYRYPTSGWTSGRVHDYPNAIYTWLDPTTPTFNSQSPWWCRNTTNLGYPYSFIEPTRWTVNGEKEACLVYWRGKTNQPVICLDDQVCSKTFEFVCELSESTAKQYHGPPPAATSVSQMNAVTPASVIQTPVNNHQNQLNPDGSGQREPKKSSKMIILIAIVAVTFLVIGLFLGLYCCLKKRQKDFNLRSSKATIPVSRTSDGSSIAPSTIVEPVKMTEPVTPKVNNQKPKNQRGGFTKQQFDEFD